MARRRSGAAAAALCLLAAAALCAVAVLFSAQPADAAVMGIDFGSEFIKVASVKPGTPFHIVVDEQSKRKFPGIVAFDHGERHFGNGAIQLAMRKPKETYLWAQRLLGKDIDSPQVASLRAQGFPWEIVALPERGGSLGFRHARGEAEDGSDDVIFSVEEIVAMSLQHVMKIAETDAGSVVRDCVITVPPYWTHRERRALEDAADIAGLNVLSLVNENTAAAIQYGIDRKYNASETHTILLYNMGSTSTKASVAHYSAYVRKERGAKGNRTVGQVDMLGLGYDETLGGQAFEHLIVEWVATEVNAQLAAKAKAKGKAPYDIRTNVKAMAKIRSAAEKAKIVLSANQESQVFLNSLHDDMDFKMLLAREQFYTMAKELLERTTGPIAAALDDAGLAKDQIDAVVIIGGGVRIPAIQAAIKSFLGVAQLTQSLDGDEAMVMGAVFRAANQSTTFQVRPFGVSDSTPYSVGVRLSGKAGAATAAGTTEEGSSEETPAAADDATATTTAATAFSKRAALFKKHNRLAKKKTVQFTHTMDFVAALAHEATETLPAGIPPSIESYNVTGLERMMGLSRYADLLASQKPRVSLSFMLDHSGLVSLTKAEATLEEMVRVLKPKPKAAPKINVTLSTESNSTAAKTNGTAEENVSAEGGATPEKAEGSEGANESGEGEKKDAAAEEAAAAAGADKDVPATPAEGEEAAAASKDASSEGTDASAAAAADTPAEEPEYTMRKKTHTVPLQVVSIGSPGSIDAMNATHKILAKATLEKLRRADELKKEIAASKNTLEAHIYATRATFSDGHVDEVSTEAQRENVMTALAAAEEWLYDQGDDSATIFHDKLAELRKLSDPVLFRRAEQTALPQALNATKSLLALVAKQVDSYPTARPWVPAADLTKLQTLADDIKEWLEETESAQSKLSASDEPVLDSEALYERIRPLHKLSSDAQKLKKPVEKPKPKAKASATKGKKNATSTANATAEEVNGTATATGEGADIEEELLEKNGASGTGAEGTQKETTAGEGAAAEGAEGAEGEQPTSASGEDNKDEL